MRQGVPEVVLFFVVVAASLAGCAAISRERPAPNKWHAVDEILQGAIRDKAFPGCVAVVGDDKGYLYAKAFGRFTYGAIPPEDTVNPPMALETLFDMASCSKVTATLSAVGQFYQRGELPLDTKVAAILGPKYTQNGKAGVSVLNCLLHNAGYPPDPNPNYWDPSFGCPETKNYHPLENFSCQDKIYQALLAQTLINPIGSVYIYSDLSFITLMYVVGSLAKTLNYVSPSDLIPGCDQGGPGALQCYFEAYVRKHVFNKLNLKNTSYLPPQAKWQYAAPTENDTTYLHRVIQGQVSDGNAYALGGIAGHAGLFSNAVDLFQLMHLWLFAKPDEKVFLNRTTTQFFMKEYNHSQSSRAIGWNTNDPTVFDEGWDLSCGSLSAKTFMHLGYTGTELCADPTRNLITILLTNRVYPSAANLKIHNVRVLFNTAVQKIFDGEL